MIIDRLQLTNFKRFADEEIVFRNGITGITGNNGTGKSSIVDAIFFALFGVSGGLASDFIVSSFAEGKKCEVQLDFTSGGVSYSLYRDFKKGKTIAHDATLYQDETVLLAAGVTEVDAEVRKIIGMGPADFRNTVYAAQKDLLTLLDLTPGKRREWFLRALGIDYLNTGSQKLLKEQADLKEKEINLLQGELTALNRQDPSAIGEMNDALICLKNRIRELQSEESENLWHKLELKEEYDLYQVKATELRRLNEQHETLTKERAELLKRADALTDALSGLAVPPVEIENLRKATEEIPFERAEVERMENQRVSVELLAGDIRSAAEEIKNSENRAAKIELALGKLNECERKISEPKNKICLAVPEITEKNDIPLELENLIRFNQEELSNLNAQKQSLEEERQVIQDDFTALKFAGSKGICPVCRRPVGKDIEHIKEEYTNRLAANAQRARENENNRVLIGEKKRRFEAQKPLIAQITQLRAQLSNREFYTPQLEMEKEQIAKATARYKQLGDAQFAIGYDGVVHRFLRLHLSDLEKAQVRLNDLNKVAAQQATLQAQIDEANRQFNEKTAALHEVKTAIDANPLDLSLGVELDLKLQAIDATLKTISQELTLSNERARTTTAKIAELEATVQRCAEVQKCLAELQEDLDILKLTRAAIAEYVVYIMQVVRTRIESEVSGIISEITGGKYDQVLLDEDFNLLVRENDRDYTVDRFSGGEQDDIAVALRIALSRYLAELHQVHESTLLIFDEIFGSQDEERRANLLTALRSQESRFPQIILISHIAEIQGEFENTLIVQGNGQYSTVQEA